MRRFREDWTFYDDGLCVVSNERRLHHNIFAWPPTWVSAREKVLWCRFGVWSADALRRSLLSPSSSTRRTDNNVFRYREEIEFVSVPVPGHGFLLAHCTRYNCLCRKYIFMESPTKYPSAYYPIHLEPTDRYAQHRSVVALVLAYRFYENTRYYIHSYARFQRTREGAKWWRSESFMRAMDEMMMPRAAESFSRCAPHATPERLIRLIDRLWRRSIRRSITKYISRKTHGFHISSSLYLYAFFPSLNISHLFRRSAKWHTFNRTVSR